MLLNEAKKKWALQPIFSVTEGLYEFWTQVEGKKLLWIPSSTLQMIMAQSQKSKTTLISVFST